MKTREFVINDTPWAEDLENGLEDYLAELYESLDSDEDYETLSGQPFCGCDTCSSREILFFLTPKIIRGYKDGAVELA